MNKPWSKKHLTRRKKQARYKKKEFKQAERMSSRWMCEVWIKDKDTEKARVGRFHHAPAYRTELKKQASRKVRKELDVPSGGMYRKYVPVGWWW